jgi:hypothetical protein
MQAEEAEEWADEDNRRGRKGKGRKLRATALTTDQKLDVATAEMDAVKKEFISFDSQSSRTIDALKVRNNSDKHPCWGCSLLPSRSAGHARANRFKNIIHET